MAWQHSSSLWGSALVHCGGDRVVAPRAVLKGRRRSSHSFEGYRKIHATHKDQKWHCFPRHTILVPLVKKISTHVNHDKSLRKSGTFGAYPYRPKGRFWMIFRARKLTLPFNGPYHPLHVWIMMIYRISQHTPCIICNKIKCLLL